MKYNLSESDFELLRKHRGDVIEKHNFIESHFSGILSNHFSPKDRDGFESLLMNSSIISFGNKIKVLRGLGYINGGQHGKLSELASIRNAFAHQDLTYSGEFEKYGETYVVLEIPILRNSGAIEKLDPFKHYEKYISLYEECLDFLRGVLAMSSMK